MLAVQVIVSLDLYHINYMAIAICIQGTWADALIIEAVADALKVTIQIVESNQGFAPLTTVYPVQERNTSSIITIGHIDECYYVSTTALQSNASISMFNELTNDTQSSRNKHFIMSIYAVCFSVIESCTYWDSSTLQALYVSQNHDKMSPK